MDTMQPVPKQWAGTSILPFIRGSNLFSVEVTSGDETAEERSSGWVLRWLHPGLQEAVQFFFAVHCVILLDPVQLHVYACTTSSAQ
jgi:hypothetical protein